MGTPLFFYTPFYIVPRRAANSSSQLRTYALGFLSVQINSHPAGKLRIKSTAGQKWKSPVRLYPLTRRGLNGFGAAAAEEMRGCRCRLQRGTELTPPARRPAGTARSVPLPRQRGLEQHGAADASAVGPPRPQPRRASSQPAARGTHRTPLSGTRAFSLNLPGTTRVAGK